jgi:hypothetical protein
MLAAAGTSKAHEATCSPHHRRASAREGCEANTRTDPRKKESHELVRNLWYAIVDIFASALVFAVSALVVSCWGALALLQHSWCTLAQPWCWCTLGALPVQSWCTPGAHLANTRCGLVVSTYAFLFMQKGLSWFELTPVGLSPGARLVHT